VRQTDEDAVNALYSKIQWGEIGAPSITTIDLQDHNSSQDTGSHQQVWIRHCSFSDREVSILQEGLPYAGW
jgi:hypothetical protein